MKCEIKNVVLLTTVVYPYLSKVLQCGFRDTNSTVLYIVVVALWLCCFFLFVYYIFLIFFHTHSMSSFGELILVTSDLFDPLYEIPLEFRQLLQKSPIPQVWCAGNASYYESGNSNSFLHKLLPQSQIIESCDGGRTMSSLCGSAEQPPNNESYAFPNHHHMICTKGNFRIGMMHTSSSTFRSVNEFQRRYNLDIVIVGGDDDDNDSKRNEYIGSRDGFHVIRPVRWTAVWLFWHGSLIRSHFSHYLYQGSMTGAFSPRTTMVSPSFVLLAWKDNSMTCYVYEYKTQVEVTKTVLEKKSS